MRVFAISDLHLPGGALKSMDVFGPHWADHFQQIQADWRARVSTDDLVLIPGDTSWAMQLGDARADLDAIGALPGRKVLLRGNHDYWWSSISQVRAALPRDFYALQNNAFLFGDVLVCGSRGWLCPGNAAFTADDQHIYTRELQRLELSLADGEKQCAGRDIWRIAMLHYPPFSDRGQSTEVTALLERYGVSDVVYGHLHGPGLASAFTGERNGVRYHLISCDGLGFRVKEIEPKNGAR